MPRTPLAALQFGEGTPNNGTITVGSHGPAIDPMIGIAYTRSRLGAEDKRTFGCVLLTTAEALELASIIMQVCK